MVLTLTVHIIIQSGPEKQFENQIPKKKFYNLSKFEVKNCSTCHILEKKTSLKNSDFGGEIVLKKSSPDEKMISINSRFASIYYVKTTIFAFFMVF